MKSVKMILTCQKRIISILKTKSRTFNELEHLCCDGLSHVTWDDYLHALADLAANGRIAKTATGFIIRRQVI